MTTQESPTQAPPTPVPTPSPAPAVPAIALPRPNPGPVAWSDPAPAAPPALGVGLALGLVVAAILAVAVVARRHRRSRLGEAGPAVPAGEAAEEESPTRRLRDAALAVRAALVAAFGPSWNARTTEEVARDPALVDRFGPDLAAAVVAFLQRADRVRFGGEECEDVDAMVDSARPMVARLREPASGGDPAVTSPQGSGNRSSGRRRRRSRLGRSGT